MPEIFVNGRVFDGRRVLKDHHVLVADGKVVDVVPASACLNDSERIDLGGNILAPGFVDVQVNGGGGTLFNDDPTPEGISGILAAHRRFGTTSILPTLISDEWPVMQRAAEAVRTALRSGMPGLRGIHFEGPYLNPSRKGIHDPARIRPVDPGAAELITASGLGAVVVTLAPETTGTEFIHRLHDAGVHVCAGHTAADYDTIRTALDAGLSGFTHLFNAMTPFSSREPGVVGAALDDPDSWCGIIADGFHVHDASLRVAVAAKPRGKMMLVTDAMCTVGAPSPAFSLQGREILASEGRCVSPDGVLAGSDLNMAAAVRNAVTRLHLSVEEALRMASRYPAEFIGLGHRIGRISAGYDADFVLLDHNLRVLETWIGGREG